MAEADGEGCLLQAVLAEDERRKALLFAPFDPITGLGAPGLRREVDISLSPGAPKSKLWLPEQMIEDPLARQAMAQGCVPPGREEDWERLRVEHDFPYWAARYARVKRKGGGDDCPLRLTHPQRKFAERIDEMRRAGKPIRLVLLKARQWGGSTVSQIYMAWLQLVHRRGLNSLIIAHQGAATDEILDMWMRCLASAGGDDSQDCDDGCPLPRLRAQYTVRSAGRSRAAMRIEERNCKVKVGTAERPDSCRGGDYNLVHLSEVGLWRQTAGKKPEDIVRAACSGILYQPCTMIVYESTANGIGNFFHREYLDARDNPGSQFRSVFVAWHEIEQNTLPFASEAEREAFARALLAGRDRAEAASAREEPGRYLWWLWQRGATLEGISWYVKERAKHTQHGSMAAECPSDDTEAFVNSGAAVFDMYQVEKLRPGCRPPLHTGDVCGRADSGEGALDGLRFADDAQGRLQVWRHPDGRKLADRYLAVVDIGGRSHKSDWSVIAVLDRAPLAQGRPPEIAAQWYGHIDMDLLAWKAMQVAAYYDYALLVIESNTLETHDRQRQVDGDQSQYILAQLRRCYPNLYARRQSEEDVRQGLPRKLGFHTNVSTKPMVISALVRAVRERLWVERDERCLDELLTYERKPNGSYGAIIGAHDDLLMTRAIAMHISSAEMPLPAEPSPSTPFRPTLF